LSLLVIACLEFVCLVSNITLLLQLTNMILHTANAAREGVSGPKLAYQRAFVEVILQMDLLTFAVLMLS
jgi:hypothetical protein